MLSSSDLNLNAELRDREYRHEFYITRTQDEIASQIRDLRVERHMTQSELASACDMKQSAISRLEGADYSGWSFKTLSRIAKALDARLQVLFVPMEKVLQERHEHKISSESCTYAQSSGIVPLLAEEHTGLGKRMEWQNGQNRKPVNYAQQLGSTHK